MKRTTLAVLGILLAAPAFAAFPDSGSVGTSSGEFLKLGADARGAAMGGAMAAAAEGAAALYWNPAALSTVMRREAHLSGMRYLDSAFHGFIAYAHPFELEEPSRRRDLKPAGLGTFGVGAIYLNAGTLAERDNTGAETGADFSPRDAAFLAGWGGTFNGWLDLGLAMKYVDSRITSKATTGAADLGMRARVPIGDIPLAVALVGRNMGGSLRYREQEEPLPASAHLGLSAKPLPRWLVAAEAAAPRDGPLYASAGAEFELPIPKQDLLFAVRLGYSSRATKGLGSLTGAAFGAGAVWSGFGVDYAFCPFGDLGAAHRVSLTWRP